MRSLPGPIKSRFLAWPFKKIYRRIALTVVVAALFAIVVARVGADKEMAFEIAHNQAFWMAAV